MPATWSRRVMVAPGWMVHAVRSTISTAAVTKA